MVSIFEFFYVVCTSIPSVELGFLVAILSNSNRGRLVTFFFLDNRDCHVNTITEHLINFGNGRNELVKNNIFKPEIYKKMIDKWEKLRKKEALLKSQYDEREKLNAQIEEVRQRSINDALDRVIRDKELRRILKILKRDIVLFEIKREEYGKVISIALVLHCGEIKVRYNYFRGPYEVRKLRYYPPSPIHGIHPQDYGTYPPEMSHKPSWEQFLTANPNSTYKDYCRFYRRESLTYDEKVIKPAYVSNGWTYVKVRRSWKGVFKLSKPIYCHDIPKNTPVAQVFVECTGHKLMENLETEIIKLL